MAYRTRTHTYTVEIKAGKFQTFLRLNLLRNTLHILRNLKIPLGWKNFDNLV